MDPEIDGRQLFHPARCQGGVEGRKEIRTALTVSAIFDIHMMTASRRLQNAATVSLFSMSLSFAVLFNTPISYSFDRS